MKTVVLTSDSSFEVTTTTTATGSTTMESETPRNSCFRQCRRDANCNCEICIASINATLDLMPQSIQRSSVTKVAASNPVRKSPVSFHPSVLSTPRSSTTYREVSLSPPLKSTARTCFHANVEGKKRMLGFGFFGMRVVLSLSLIFAAEFGFSLVVSRFFMPKLSLEMMKNLGEKSLVLQDLNQRIVFLKKELESLVDGKVSNCSSIESKWDINQDGLLLSSRCVLYQSAVEEVSIWGWPLQTAGLLTAEFSPRSFTILSGRVTEWSNGESSYLIRKKNSSWVQGKWSASAIQLDPSTWLLEYQRSLVVKNARLITAALEFLKFRITTEFKKMKQEFWLMSAFRSHNTHFARDTFTIPT